MIKPYYQDEWVTIYNGDCREILPEIPKVDLVLTDPPYGIAHPTDYKSRGRGKLADCRDYPRVYDDDKPFDPKLLLSLNVPTLLFGANYFADRLPPSSGWIVWDKCRPDTLDQASCELAWTNFVKGTRVFHFMWHGMLRASDEELYHPTQKPIALMNWILNLRWTPAGTVLDPYFGSGSTLVACKLSGRYCIGIEINKAYCDIAIKRLQQTVMNFEPVKEKIEQFNFLNMAESKQKSKKKYES